MSKKQEKIGLQALKDYEAGKTTPVDDVDAYKVKDQNNMRSL